MGAVCSFVCPAIVQPFLLLRELAHRHRGCICQLAVQEVDDDRIVRKRVLERRNERLLLHERGASVCTVAVEEDVDSDLGPVLRSVLELDARVERLHRALLVPTLDIVIFEPNGRSAISIVKCKIFNIREGVDHVGAIVLHRELELELTVGLVTVYEPAQLPCLIRAHIVVYVGAEAREISGATLAKYRYLVLQRTSRCLKCLEIAHVAAAAFYSHQQREDHQCDPEDGRRSWPSRRRHLELHRSCSLNLAKIAKLRFSYFSQIATRND